MATTTHPSDRLYRGEVADFREALNLVIWGMEAEARDSEHMNAQLAPDEIPQYHLDTKIFTDHKRAAQRALAMYREEVEAAEARVIERLRELGDDFECFADALEGGDYSGLAW